MCNYPHIILHLPVLPGSMLTCVVIGMSLFHPSAKSTSRFWSRNGTRLRRQIYMYIKFWWDEISQSTANIKLLPVSEKGWLPYWNCTSGFDFDLFIVIGSSFSISLSNFVVIRLSAANDAISIFQDGGHSVGNLLPVSVLVMALVWEDGNLMAHQISMRYFNPRLR